LERTLARKRARKKRLLNKGQRQTFEDKIKTYTISNTVNFTDNNLYWRKRSEKVTTVDGCLPMKCVSCMIMATRRPRRHRENL